MLFCLEKLKQRYLTPQGIVQNWASELLDYTQCVLKLWELGLGVEITISNNCLSLDTTLASVGDFRAFVAIISVFSMRELCWGQEPIGYSILHLHKIHSEDCILTRLTRSWKQKY